MILEALGIDHKDGTSKKFKIILSVSIFIGMLSSLVSHVTGLSVVQMVTLFPVFNGVFGLPITAILLFWAVNDKKIMGSHTNSWKLNFANIYLVLFSEYISVHSG